MKRRRHVQGRFHFWGETEDILMNQLEATVYTEHQESILRFGWLCFVALPADWHDIFSGLSWGAPHVPTCVNMSRIELTSILHLRHCCWGLASLSVCFPEPEAWASFWMPLSSVPVANRTALVSWSCYSTGGGLNEPHSLSHSLEAASLSSRCQQGSELSFWLQQMAFQLCPHMAPVCVFMCRARSRVPSSSYKDTSPLRSGPRTDDLISP